MNESGPQRLSITNRNLPITSITTIFPSISISNKSISFKILNMVDGNESSNALTFATNATFLRRALENSNVTGILITSDLKAGIEDDIQDKTFLISDDPIKHFFKLHNHLYESTPFYDSITNSKNEIPQSCKISSSAIIGKNVIIGEDCEVREGVVLNNTTIGSGVTIKEGAKVGTELSELKMIDGKYFSVKHDASVIIGNDIEIGPNTIISRGIFGKDTVIENDTKICGGVIIGHRCHIGQNTFIAAGSNICGSVKIGSNVWVGPGTIITNGISIQDGADLTIGSVVVDEVSAGEKVTGNFAIPHMNFMLSWMRSKKNRKPSN